MRKFVNEPNKKEKSSKAKLALLRKVIYSLTHGFITELLLCIDSIK